jgi:mRNA interferase MazF
VDLGISGKVRFFVVVSRRDDDPPRALALCVPITTQNRDSDYGGAP